MKGFSVILLIFAFQVHINLQLETCPDPPSKCSGLNSYFNETLNSCICGLDSLHMWGKKCQFGRQRFVASTGYISEAEQNYHVNSKYMFSVTSNTSNLPIKFTINNFVSECNWDYLYIFDGSSTESPLLSAFNGNLVQNQNHTRTVIAKSGSAYLYFFTDKCTSDDGFNITYQVSTCPFENCNNHGICNDNGSCSCEKGWSGQNCTIQSCAFTVFSVNVNTKWCKEIQPESDKVLPRASHAVTLTQSNQMWIFAGISTIKSNKARHKETLNRVLRYDLEKRIWSFVQSYSPYSDKEMRFGHSMVEYGGSFYVFGGAVYTGESYADSVITNDLLEFKLSTNSWEKHNSDALSVTGHASVVIQGHMYSFFGYNNKHIFVNIVQKLKLSSLKKSWVTINAKGAILKGRTGHSATYDQVTNKVFVFGGFTSLYAKVTEFDLLIFDVSKETWFVGVSAPSPRALHSAGIIGNNLIIFGGKSYIRSYPGSTCFTNDIMAYSIDCDKWVQKKVDILDEKKRYGHSAVVANSSLHVFGGFNGEYLNDVFEIVIGDDCNQYSTQRECLGADLLSGCVWHKGSRKCIQFEQNIPTSAIEKPGCSEINFGCSNINKCTDCLAFPKCSWIEDSCSIRNALSQTEDISSCSDFNQNYCKSLDSCYSCNLQSNCSWSWSLGCSYSRKSKEKCFAPYNVTSCNEFDSCSTCMDPGKCLWCESTKSCLPVDTYIVNYSYGQCREYVQSKLACSSVKCEDQFSCRNCLQLPECGWCETTEKCSAGSYNESFGNQCPDDGWMFTHCPECHCNGQSKCYNGTDTCIQCNENVVGSHCEECAHGYFGNPANNGSCSQKCECNGHLLSCDNEGKCLCNAQGVTGSQCDTCDPLYYGDARNGGLCYYPLQPNYQYISSPQAKVIAGYVLLSTQENQLFDVSIKRTRGAIGYLNLTIVYANNATTTLASNFPLGGFTTKITKDTYKYPGKVQILVVVFGWEPTTEGFSIKIFFDPDESPFDLVYFLIMFIVCFISLLVILVIFWKIKQRYDRFIYQRRQKQEMEKRISRPFTSLKVLLWDKVQPSNKEKPPSLLGIQLLKQVNDCGPASFLVQLPGDETTKVAPAGQCGLCIGTILISHTAKPKTKNYTRSYVRKKRTTKALPV